MNGMREERLQIMLSPQEMSVVDDFRFAHRMPTRAAAVRELLKLGLESASGRWSQVERLRCAGSRPHKSYRRQ